MPDFQPPHVGDFAALGEKLIELARLGAGELEARIAASELPDLHDPGIFARWLGEAAGVAFPPAIGRIRFVQADAGELVVNLPGRDALEGALANPAGYDLPSFYAGLFPCAPLPRIEPGEQLELLRQRIGDYSMNQCR